MSERIDPISSSDQNKKEKLAASNTDPEQFRKLMEISEAELDKQRKRKWNEEDEEDNALKNVSSDEKEKKSASPYDTKFYTEEDASTTKQIQSDEKKDAKIDQKAKKPIDKTQLSEDLLDEVDVDKLIKELSEKEKKIDAKSKKLKEDIQISNSKSKELKEITKGNYPSKDSKIKIKKHDDLISKTFSSKEDIQINSYDQLSLDLKILAETATKAMPSEAPKDVHQLFTHLVGMLIHIDNNGITKTEVTLNSSTMQGSVFYGSTITLTRYSTAPNSYNIKLTGSPQAVNIFNDNLSSLIAAFRKQKYGFEIYKISAEQETKDKPLFHRKKKISKKDTDAGGNLTS